MLQYSKYTEASAEIRARSKFPVKNPESIKTKMKMTDQ